LIDAYLFGIDGQRIIEQRVAAPNQGTQRSFRDGQWNSGSFAAFRVDKNWGPQKWTDAIRNFWTSNCDDLILRDATAL
jgi:hypothetical protein